jgi:hypothetical protein
VAVTWRPLLARYLWAIGFREALGSDRWSAGGKTVFLRRLRHFFGHDVIVVMPFPRDTPPAFRDRVEEARAMWTAERERRDSNNPRPAA